MLQQVTASELTEYLALDALQPLPDRRSDLQTGLLAAAVVNHSMSPPKRPARPLDFMPLDPRSQEARDQPVLVSDPVKHGELIAQTIFGNRVKK